MTDVTTSPDAGFVAWLQRQADRLADRLDGRNAEARADRGRRLGTVHAVGTSRWYGLVDGPAPACHTGFSGGEASALTPTYRAVNCAKCLRKAGVRSAQAVASPLQPPLF